MENPPSISSKKQNKAWVQGRKTKVEAEVCSNFNPIRNKKFTQNLYKKRLRGSNLLFYPYNIVYDFDVFKI